MLLSTIDTLLGFYAAFVVIALGASLCGFFPLNVALIHWFERKRARALSSMQLGIALGGLVRAARRLVAADLRLARHRLRLRRAGHRRSACRSPRVIRSRPEDYGLTVDGLPHEPPPWTSRRPSAEPRGPATRDFTAREALRTPAFWLISLGHGFALFVVHAVNVHAITHMKEGLGYSHRAAASLVITLMTVCQWSA